MEFRVYAVYSRLTAELRACKEKGRVYRFFVSVIKLDRRWQIAFHNVVINGVHDDVESVVAVMSVPDPV